MRAKIVNQTVHKWVWLLFITGIVYVYIYIFFFAESFKHATFQLGALEMKTTKVNAHVDESSFVFVSFFSNSTKWIFHLDSVDFEILPTCDDFMWVYVHKCLPFQ